MMELETIWNDFVNGAPKNVSFRVVVDDRGTKVLFRRKGRGIVAISSGLGTRESQA